MPMFSMRDPGVLKGAEVHPREIKTLLDSKDSEVIMFAVSACEKALHLYASVKTN